MNNVKLTGTISKQFTYSHSNHGENFFLSEIEVIRTHGTIDSIPIIVSERTESILSDFVYKHVKILGRIASHDYKGKLNVFIFVNHIELTDFSDDENMVEIEGFISSTPTHRFTPSGREISDMILAVNREYFSKSDYIPIISWGRNADYTSKLPIGSHLILLGRIQSRQYTKDDNVHTVYEISVSNIKRVA